MSTLAAIPPAGSTAAFDAASTGRLAAQGESLGAGGSRDELRRRLGEFVGGVFFGPVLQEMQKSPFKTRYSDGGRGEAAFAGQLALELSKRAGRSAANGFASQWIGTIERRIA